MHGPCFEGAAQVHAESLAPPRCRHPAYAARGRFLAAVQIVATPRRTERLVRRAIADLSHGFRDRYAERSIAVQDGDADLESRDLSADVPRHALHDSGLPANHESEALARQFYTMHLCQSARPRCFAARRASFSFCATSPAVMVFQGFVCLRGGNEDTNATGSRECPNAWAPRSAMAPWYFRVS